MTMTGYMQEKHKLLNDITKGCRLDMHEPDEQGLSARVIGDYLDNAMGEDIEGRAVAGGYQEFVVVFKRENLLGVNEYLRVNLATLVALARQAKED